MTSRRRRRRLYQLSSTWSTGSRCRCCHCCCCCCCCCYGGRRPDNYVDIRRLSAPARTRRGPRLGPAGRARTRGPRPSPSRGRRPADRLDTRRKQSLTGQRRFDDHIFPPTDRTHARTRQFSSFSCVERRRTAHASTGSHFRRTRRSTDPAAAAAAKRLPVSKQEWSNFMNTSLISFSSSVV